MSSHNITTTMGSCTSALAGGGGVRPRLDPQHDDPEYNETLSKLYDTVLDTLPHQRSTGCWGNKKRNQDNHHHHHDLALTHTDTSWSVDEVEPPKTQRCFGKHKIHMAEDDDDTISLLDPHCNKKFHLFRKVKNVWKRRPKEAAVLRKPKKSLVPAVLELNRLNCLEDRSGAFPDLSKY